MVQAILRISVRDMAWNQSRLALFAGGWSCRWLGSWRRVASGAVKPSAGVRHTSTWWPGPFRRPSRRRRSRWPASTATHLPASVTSASSRPIWCAGSSWPRLPSTCFSVAASSSPDWQVGNISFAYLRRLLSELFRANIISNKFLS